MIWIGVAVAANWVGLYLVTWLYVGWLWLISGDIKLEGWVWWRRVMPVARFRLVSRKSWFARAWAQWYGHGMLGAMIHRDEEGAFDDSFVEGVIVHELRHCVQHLVLGALFYPLYGLSALFQIARGRDGYRDNWFERDARRATEEWLKSGRQISLDFGKRQ